MSGAPQSILYVLPASLPIDYSALGAVQQAALDKQLPFAVVYQLRERTDDLDDRLAVLRRAETQLAQFHIPLILLLGPSEPILESLVHHSGAELYAEANFASPHPLEVHPYVWPGNVRSIEELQPIIDQMTTGENRTFC